MKVTVIHNVPERRFEIDIPESEIENKDVDEIGEIIYSHVLQHVDQNNDAFWEVRNERVHGVGTIKNNCKYGI